MDFYDTVNTLLFLDLISSSLVRYSLHKVTVSNNHPQVHILNWHFIGTLECSKLVLTKMLHWLPEMMVTCQ